jgi:FtsP/CotA-like multicopper oxidase with cupredoxin domain
MTGRFRTGLVSPIHRLLVPCLLPLLMGWNGAHSGPTIEFNDNRTPAGTLVRGVLTVALEARLGDWHPLGTDKPGVPIYAFGEAGKPLQDPGPLLRVHAGTEVRAGITNRTDSTLVVHGLSRRQVAVMDTLVVPPGETREARFVADAEGTYYYWASTRGESFADRQYEDAHLNGALIVDPAGAAPKADRVFVVERWEPQLDSARADLQWLFGSFTINGRPWPNTERLTYTVGDSVRWRIINATNDVHPLHLHGFYFRVDARGDVQRDTVYWPSQRRMDVTEPLWDGATMNMVWSPDRPGGWIFHCHLNWHVIPNSALPPDTESLTGRMGHVLNGYPNPSMNDHARTGMGGLVLAIQVRAAGSRRIVEARRTLRLLVQSDSGPGDKTRRFGYVLRDDDGPASPDSIAVPGPAIVLHRGEPTRIWVVNHTAEMTQVHWHGIELESLYDGVAGVSGGPDAVEPPIMPGDSFEVRMTPPRAGSFMYHTHINDVRQQSHGLYGPLIVIDSGATWNPDTDRVFIAGDAPDYKPELNGTRRLAPITLRPGVAYRFRLMNITMGAPGLAFSLVRNTGPVQWTPLGKDGYRIPPWQSAPRRSVQSVSIGETYDFEVQAADTTSATLELRTPSGALVTSQAIRFAKSGGR